MYHLRMYPYPILDEPNHPFERNITFDNGLPESDDNFQRTTLCVTLLPHGHLDIKPLEITEGVTFRLLRKYLAIGEVVRARWVNAVEGIWLRLDGRDASTIMSVSSKPFLTDFVTDIAKSFGRTLVWEDDIDEIELKDS